MQATHDAVAAVPFSRQLREATDDAHRAAESSDFVTALIDGSLTRDEYATLVVQLHAVYGVLEDAVDSVRMLPALSCAAMVSC